MTVQFLAHGLVRKRVVSKGPLHPDWEHANRWAEYLRSVGTYSDVRVESSHSASAANMGQRN